MREIRLKAMAKINLGLDVLRRREDGYHEVRMIMQTVRLHDRIRLQETAAPGIRMEVSLGYLPCGPDNLAWKAAQLLMDAHDIKKGVFITLEKHIPVAAGLAGGSSDAAAVLVGMNRLLSLGHTREELMRMGKSLGADVPYCVLRGTALAEGIGEKLTVLPALPDCAIVLAKPGVHVSTKFVYENLNAAGLSEHPDIDAQIRALEEGNLAGVVRPMGNVLETVTVPAFPAIGRIRQKMLDGGAEGAMMSGSGPTVFGIFTDPGKAREVLAALREDEDVRQAFLTEPFRPSV